MKKILTFIALCFFFLMQSIAQSNCSNPYQLTLCPSVYLTGQTNAGMGDDFPGACNIAGEDMVYRIYTPGGASTLFVSIVSASVPLRLSLQADTCGTSTCNTATNVPAGTSTRTFNVIAVNYYTLWVDASTTVTFSISFGGVTSSTYLTIPDTQGNLQLDSSICDTPVFHPAKPFFQVAYNSVYKTNPMTLSPLFVPGVLKVVVYFKNTTGVEGIKRFVFQFNPNGTGFTSIAASPSVFPGFYRPGNWQASNSGNTWTLDFNDSLITGKGDFNTVPNSCLRYEFRFNVTPVSNSPSLTTVNVTAASDGFGVGFTGWVNSGCCPSLSPSCLGASSGNPATAANAFGFGFADPGGPLPVTLLDFSAAQENDHVLLLWSTASEINNDYFTIEKSQDGFSWTGIATVRGAVNSTTTVHYESIDHHPLTGLSYYRLKQTDYDGTSEYFSPVSVLFKANEIEIFPNPASTQVEVKDYSRAGISDISLYNSLGKKMQLSSLKNYSGTLFDISVLPRGLYLLVVEGTNREILKQEKIILTR